MAGGAVAGTTPAVGAAGDPAGGGDGEATGGRDAPADATATLHEYQQRRGRVAEEPARPLSELLGGEPPRMQQREPGHIEVTDPRTAVEDRSRD
jgi:hypothetical protein